MDWGNDASSSSSSPVGQPQGISKLLDALFTAGESPGPFAELHAVRNGLVQLLGGVAHRPERSQVPRGRRIARGREPVFQLVAEPTHLLGRQAVDAAYQVIEFGVRHAPPPPPSGQFMHSLRVMSPTIERRR